MVVFSEVTHRVENALMSSAINHLGTPETHTHGTMNGSDTGPASCIRFHEDCNA